MNNKNRLPMQRVSLSGDGTHVAIGNAAHHCTLGSSCGTTYADYNVDAYVEVYEWTIA